MKTPPLQELLPQELLPQELLPQELLAAFDHSGDPLDDPGLRAWLLEHPEQLAAFATLRERLSDLSTLPPGQVWPAVRPKRPWWLLATVAGLPAAGFALWFVGLAWRPPAQVPTAPGPSAQLASLPGTALPRPQLAPASAVHSVVVSTQTLGRDGLHEATHRHGSLARQTIVRHLVASPPQPNVTSHSTRSVSRNFIP